MFTGCSIDFDDGQITHSILLQSKRPNQAGFNTKIVLAYLGVRGMQGASEWSSEGHPNPESPHMSLICTLLTVHLHFHNISIVISTL